MIAYIVQLHGEPGSGKTTLGRELARALPAVHLELDVTTAALTRARVHPGADGRVTYEVHYSTAESLLHQSLSVVLDNPVFRPEVEQRSMKLATLGKWAMIECVCDDRDELARRLADRPSSSVPATAIGDWRARPGTAEPSAPRLRLRTDQPIEDAAIQALRHIVE